jgi:hypothetical protein
MTRSHRHPQGWGAMLKKVIRTAVLTACLGKLAQHHKLEPVVQQLEPIAPAQNLRKGTPKAFSLGG